MPRTGLKFPLKIKFNTILCVAITQEKYDNLGANLLCVRIDLQLKFQFSQRSWFYYSGTRYSAVTDVTLLCYPGKIRAAGSCTGAIHCSPNKFSYRNVGNKSRRFSSKVKRLLVEGPQFFSCHSMDSETQ